MLQCGHPIFPSDLCLHIMKLTFLDEWRYSIMASGELYVIVPSVLLMQMLFMEWQVSLKLSAHGSGFEWCLVERADWPGW